MKKLLLATAAVMALSASAAQAEVKLDLGGYFKGYAGWADQDDVNGAAAGDVQSFDFKRKSAVTFNGETTLDNGLTVGYFGELLQEPTGDEVAGMGVATGTSSPGVAAGAASDINSQLQESYLYMSGNWGRVNMGRTNGAAYLLQVSAPSADSNIDGLDNVVSFYNMVANTAQQSYKHAGPEVDGFAGLAPQQYSDKVTYLTPKFNGFQAGVSYSAQYDSKIFANNVSGMQLDNNGFEDLMEIAARWDGEFSNVGVHLGAGYSTADTEAAVFTDDYKEWNAGAKLTWDAFGLGVAYNEDNGVSAAPGDNEIWVVGADYTWGAYKFGASWMDSSTEMGVGAGEDELDRLTLGATYTFGPGMDFRGAVAFYDGDDATVGAVDNDATVITLGTDVQF